MLNNYFYKVLVSGINVRMDGYSLVEATTSRQCLIQ